ncbi:hypothetical protein [Palleronia salina]|uniref:hypothetical protein n=1 Tax=Palleronia salina TaxID=313368 RepID=UPI001114F815|nr:hypothetical protein [Palleronia salina]
MFSTSYQVGCMALVALGQAEDRDWGAAPKSNPFFPKDLPRWDDVCFAVLWLAAQQRKLSYRLLDGSVPKESIGYGFTVAPSNPRVLSAPNIRSIAGLGPAHAQPDVIDCLERLGLVSSGRWTEPATSILWRTQPAPWGMDVARDPRFDAEVYRASGTIPDCIRSEIERQFIISDEQ